VRGRREGAGRNNADALRKAPIGKGSDSLPGDTGSGFPAPAAWRWPIRPWSGSLASVPRAPRGH